MLDSVKTHTLPNKLRVVLAPMDTASATVIVLMGAGSRYETEQEMGIAHFLEHMMFKGTKKRPTAMDIAKEIDGIGGQFNAYTAKDHTGYWVKAAVDHVPSIIDLLSDMTLNSLLDQTEIDREKGVIIEELNMYEDTPMRKVDEVFEALLYGDTPLGREIIGTKKTIRSFTRDMFAGYMNRLYRPNNAVVVVAGGIGKQQEAVLATIQETFGTWEAQDTPEFEKNTITQSKPGVKIVSKKTEQTHICIGTHAYHMTHEKRYALALLSVILGGGMSSRLFHEVRERRGLAYYVRSGAQKYQDVGNFVTQAGIDIAKTEEATQVILEEYQKMSTIGDQLSVDEINKAKSYIKGHTILGLEDSRGVAGFVGNALLLEGKIRALSDMLAKIDAVTADEIHEVAADIFQSKNLNFAAIGPFESGMEEKIAGLLG